MIDCIDYVITHKPYHVDQSDMYRKLCVGDYYELLCLSEKSGSNISEYNDRLNELTGLYWIWKNMDDEYVGLSHYRRFFVKDGKRLDRKTVENILNHDGYDLIIHPLLELRWRVVHNISLIVGDELTIRTYDLIEHALKEKHPEYMDAFEDVMRSSKFYPKNMFVCRREIMDLFCEWLFSFIIDVTDKVDVTGRSEYEKRVCGYFGETMWTVWLRKQNLKIYEMPIMTR